jgi:hypothetical protein
VETLLFPLPLRLVSRRSRDGVRVGVTVPSRVGRWRRFSCGRPTGRVGGPGLSLLLTAKKRGTHSEGRAEGRDLRFTRRRGDAEKIQSSSLRALRASA